MTGWIEGALCFGLLAALVAVVQGQVLSRAVLACAAAMSALGLALLGAGGGVLALCFVLVALVWLAVLQLFGWMLVDVDHDHLPGLSWRTTGVRVAALTIFAAALVVLARTLWRRGELARAVAAGGELAPTSRLREALDPAAIGGLFIGVHGDLALPVGLLLAAGLLAALCLLRDSGSEAG
ncbi:MAG: hypothetical protein R3F35_12070 [Myxococcota bacterium]